MSESSEQTPTLKEVGWKSYFS